MSETIKEKDTLDQYVQSMVLYSIVINRRRSIPAMQDGLKPVQRRILYAAYHKNLVGKRNDKTLALIGHVSGELHPHGDCLHGSTKIYTLNGNSVSLYDLTVQNKPVEILAIDPSTMEYKPAIAHSFRIGQYANKEYHIKFSNGYEIVCTSNHPFMLPDGSFVKAENLHPYMRLKSTSIIFDHSTNNINELGRPKIHENYIQDIVYYSVNLVNYNLKSVGELYDEYKSKVIEPIHFIEEPQIEKEKDLTFISKASVYNVFDKIVDNGLPLTYDSYYKIRSVNSHYNLDITYEKICTLLELYKLEIPYIENVYTVDVNNEPMFDFTVDGYENMIIPIDTPENMNNKFGIQSIPCICAHNSAVAEAINGLAEWYKTKYILMYPGGGYGNVYNDVASAPRYTHASLSDFGYESLIEDLKSSENIVDWIETYKRNGTMEPEYLPAKVPMLLVNGTFGIGVGMQVNIPSHNLHEVIDVTRHLLKDPNYKFCLIPDLCMPCELIDTDWKKINESGNGSFKVRGKIIDETDNKGNITLHVVSLPQMTTTCKVCEKILDMVDKKELPMIKDIYNGLDEKTGMPDIIIKLKPGVDSQYVKNILYAKTPIQTTQSVNFEVVSSDGINIKRYSYREYLLEFIDYRMNTKFRLYCNKLQQVMTRHHQVDAFIKVLESGQLDTIINMIRKQKSADEEPIVEFIIKKCGTTDVQARFIIHTQISNLTMAHLNKYKEERNRLEIDKSNYLSKVTDDGTLIKQEIDAELAELDKKYNTPRLCKVISTAEENNIPSGMFKIIITEKNFIRKIPDIDKINVIRKDNPKLIIRIDNTETLLLFDNKGKVFSLPVYKIPITDPKSGAGTDARILCKNLTADIINIFSKNIFKNIAECGNKHYLTVLTKNNYIKKMDIEDFITVPPSGLIYSKVSPDDEVVGLALIAHNLDIIVNTNHKALRFNLKDVPLVKRNAQGVIAMKTEDPIKGFNILYPDISDIVAITYNGKINRFNSIMLTSHKRPGVGQGIIKLDPNDEILAILGGSQNDIIRITTIDGSENIPVSAIKVKSPIAPGSRYQKSRNQILKVDIIKG